MHKNNILKHKSSGELLRLITIRESGINTYLQVDNNNKPIIKKRAWSVHPAEQTRLIKGFKKLELWKLE